MHAYHCIQTYSAAQLDRTATPFLSVRDVATIFQNVTAAFVAQYPHIHENVGSSVKYYEKYLQPHLESLAHFGVSCICLYQMSHRI